MSVLTARTTVHQPPTAAACSCPSCETAAQEEQRLPCVPSVLFVVVAPIKPTVKVGLAHDSPEVQGE